jgi:hypothetical protein
LLDRDVFPNDEPMGRQFEQLWKNAADVLGEIHKHDNDRKISAGLHQARRVYPIPAIEPAHGVKRARARDVFTPKHFENLAPLVGLVQIYRDLYGGFHLNQIPLASDAPSATATKHTTLVARIFKRAEGN